MSRRSISYLPHIDKFPSLNEKIDSINMLLDEKTHMVTRVISRMFEKSLTAINDINVCRDTKLIDTLFKRLRVHKSKHVYFDPINKNINDIVTSYYVNKQRYSFITSDELKDIEQLPLTYNYVNKETQTTIDTLFKQIEDNIDALNLFGAANSFEKLRVCTHNTLLSAWPFTIDNVLNEFICDIYGLTNQYGISMIEELCQKYQYLLYWSQ